MELAGRIAVVTGASSGIGEAIALALARAGMTVVVVARRGDRLDELATRRPGLRPYVADVTSDADVDGLAQRVDAEFGACHLLVNCAGARLGRRFNARGDVDSIAAVLEVNFLGTVRCMAAFADLLASSAPSRVVNIGSVAGKLAVGAPGYSASKFATVGFSEAVRLEWAPRGVAVCQVNPGFVHTEGFPQEQFVGSPWTRRLLSRPEAVADAVVAVARSGQRERTVPRWYRALVVTRHVAAPLFWGAAARLESVVRRP